MTEQQTNTVILGLGTNLGSKEENFKRAQKHIQNLQDTTITEMSSIYLTPPFGILDQPNFYNQVIICQTLLSPQGLHKKTQEIEQMMGRVKKEKNGPRIIDIDILFYSNQRINTPDLIIPHPGAATRATVLIPLEEIYPEFMHPTEKKTITQLCNTLTPQETKGIEKR